MDNSTPSLGAEPRAGARQRTWLLTSEDWWAVYLGLFLVILVYGAYAFYNQKSPLDALLGSAGFVPWPNVKPLGVQLAANLRGIVAVYLLLLVLTSIAVGGMGYSVAQYAGSFTILYLLAIGAVITGTWYPVFHYGLEYPFWALLVGLVIGNFWHMSPWFRVTAERTEFYVKTSLVLLGAFLGFGVIVTGGLRGFAEAATVVTVGFIVAFLVSRALGFDNRFAAVLGAGASVCGISASIAMGNSVKAKTNEINYVISLVVLYALVLIFVLPLLSRAFGLSDVVAGAWIGGSELADSAGVAAAQMVSTTAVKSFTLVKLNRDVMIGFLAFIFAIIAVTRWEVKAGTTPNAWVMWERFPKFVLAFLAASLLTTVMTALFHWDPKALATVAPIKTLNTIRTYLFVLAFVCIGLNTRFVDIRRFGWRPIVAFTTVAVVNLITGFVMANLLFTGFTV